MLLAVSTLMQDRFDRDSSSYLLLAVFVVVGVLGGLLHWLGAVGLAMAVLQAVMNGGVRLGFRLWRSWLSWAGWPRLGTLVLALTVVGALAGHRLPWLALLLGLLLQFAGVCACLAYVYIDLERCDVARGYKAIYNPLKGQGLAVNLVAFGDSVGILLLVAATIGVVGGFTLMNQALYETIGRDWYKVGDSTTRANFIDFLAYTLINLFRVVDLLHIASTYNVPRVEFIEQSKWPASTLLLLFRSFFTLVLLQQITAAVRQGRLLAETITDFWSPHQPIHERARGSLPQYGPGAVWPLLLSLRTVTTLSAEQRTYIARILAEIGPATIPTLTQNLHDASPWVRGAAAAALGQHHALEAMPALATLHNDADDWVRQCVAEALGRIGAACSPNALRRYLRSARRTPAFGMWRLFGARNAPCEAVPDPQALAVRALRSLLTDVSALVRHQAARSLALLGRTAAAAAPDLIARLKEAREAVRCAAAEALGKVGRDHDGTVPALQALLRDKSAAVQAAGARALGEVGKHAVAAIPALLPLLNDAYAEVRHAAAEAVNRIGPVGDAALEALTIGLESEDNAVRAQAAEALGAIGPQAAEAAPALAGALDDENDRVRASAAQALARMGEAAAEAVPELMDALRDPDNWVSALAAEALGEIGEEAAPAVPALVCALEHANPQVRANAAAALGKLGHAARPAVNALAATLTDEDDTVRIEAVTALGHIGHLHGKGQRAVLHLLADGTPEVRAAAVTALASGVGRDRAVMTLLPRLLADPAEQVKTALAQALARLTPEAQAVQALTALLGDESPAVQTAAARALGKLGAKAVPAGRELLRLLQSGEAEVREEALRALALAEPPEAVAAYLCGLKDARAAVRVLASAGLTKQSRLPPEAAVALVESLHDAEIQVRANAARVLARLETPPEEALPALLECVSDADDGLRLHALLALRRAPIEDAREALLTLLGDGNSRIRLLAADALLAADPDEPEAHAVLTQALNDPANRLRRAALERIAALGARAAGFRAALRERIKAETNPELAGLMVRVLERLPEAATVTEPQE